MTIPVIAVDGGGTRCRLSYDGKILVETGPANVATDFDGALAGLSEGLQALAQRAGLTPGQLAATPAYLGLAGCLSSGAARRIAALLPCRQILVEDDRRCAVRGALGAGDGALAHCGTGSFLALQATGTIRLAGGWGAVLGDEASAAWVGQRALALTLDVADGLYPASPMTRSLSAAHDGPPGIISFAARARPHEFGQIAPEVTSCADAGDPLARSILQQGARYLGDTLQKMGLSEGMTLCMTGGIASHFTSFMSPALQSAVSGPRGTPLEGALSLARDMVSPDLTRSS